MKTIWTTFQVAFTTLGGALGWYFGGRDGFFIALIAFVIADYITGVSLIYYLSGVCHHLLGLRQPDLFFTLNVIDIHIPALRDRVGDIPLLVSRFIKELSAANGGAVTGITPAAMKMLEGYPWPGNVRELRNTIEKMVVLSTGGMLDVADIPEEMRVSSSIPIPISATGTLAETEKAKILAALQSVGNNRSKAARVLGISRRTLYRKLDEYAKEGDIA